MLEECSKEDPSLPKTVIIGGHEALIGVVDYDGILYKEKVFFLKDFATKYKAFTALRIWTGKQYRSRSFTHWANNQLKQNPPETFFAGVIVRFYTKGKYLGKFTGLKEDGTHLTSKRFSALNVYKAYKEVAFLVAKERSVRLNNNQVFDNFINFFLPSHERKFRGTKAYIEAMSSTKRVIRPKQIKVSFADSTGVPNLICKKQMISPRKFDLIFKVRSNNKTHESIKLNLTDIYTSFHRAVIKTADLNGYTVSDVVIKKHFTSTFTPFLKRMLGKSFSKYQLSN